MVNNIKNKLHIGITLTDSFLPAWKQQLIESITQQDFVNIIGIICLGQNKQQAKNTLWEKHIGIDTRYFKPKPDAFKVASFAESFPNIPTIELATLKESTIDLLIHLGHQPIPTEFYPTTSMGVLSFTHGEDHMSAEDFLGYWEFIRFQEVITSALVLKTTPEEMATIIYRTWSMMPSLSMSRSRNEHMWKLAGLVPRALRAIYENGTFHTLGQVAPQQSTTPYPTRVEALTNLSKHFFRMAFKAFRKLQYKEQWILLLNLQQEASTDFSTFKKILPPKDRFWADPFLVKKDNKQYLFFEELPFATEKGHLSVIEIDEHGVQSPAVTILNKSYHLSYPFIFEFEHQYYMIPESYEERSIQL